MMIISKNKAHGFIRGSAMLLCVAPLALLFSLGVTTPDTPTLHFPQAGFSITPLDAPPTADHMVLTMYLPATDNFSPNVGVLVQNYPSALDTYLANTKSQLVYLAIIKRT